MNARETLIQEHQDFVHALARQLHRRLPRHVDYDDLVMFGQIGLIEAAGAYDADSPAMFTTFSYRRVRGAMLDGIRKMAWRRMPSAAQRTTVEPDAEFAEAADAFRKAVAQVGAVYMTSQVTRDERKIDPTETGTPDEAAQTRESMGRLRDVLETLPRNHRSLLHSLYFEDESISDHARRVGVHKSTITRRHQQALDALRQAMVN